MVAEDPGPFVEKVLEVESWSGITKFTEAFAVKVAGKEGKENQFYVNLWKGITGIIGGPNLAVKVQNITLQ